MSASRSQVFSQKQLEACPLVIEPPKVLFYSPVLVFDYQSLYPSIIISHNICYSTCLGRLLKYTKQDYKNLVQENSKNNNNFYVNNEGLFCNDPEFLISTHPENKKLGVYMINKSLLLSLKSVLVKHQVINFDSDLNFLDNTSNYSIYESKEVIKKLVTFIMQNTFVSPNNILFVRKNIRIGILPMILEELLLTRIMIKNSMKLVKNKDDSRFKELNNRQLGIKLYANVTYGYTSAGYSGRMPCNDLAESIVYLGRYHLNLAIKKVSEYDLGNLFKKNSNYKYTNCNLNSKNDTICKEIHKAEVIYGDTDSLFALFNGMTMKDSFALGNMIASDITISLPEPMKLHFEKIYLPLCLASKKRYIGLKFEDYNSFLKYTKSENKDFPLDSKGLETVRRDNCLLVSILLEKIIKIIFKTQDLSLVKQCLFKTLKKVYQGRMDERYFSIAREVKLGTYKNPTSLPSSAQVAYSIHLKDVNYFPLFGQRVSFVVIDKGNKNAKLKESLISLDEYSQYNRNIYCSNNEKIITQFMTINYKYYIEKLILPTISRLFINSEVDVFEWYDQYEGYFNTLNHKSSLKIKEKIRSNNTILNNCNTSNSNDKINLNNIKSSYNDVKNLVDIQYLFKNMTKANKKPEIDEENRDKLSTANCNNTNEHIKINKVNEDNKETILQYIKDLRIKNQLNIKIDYVNSICFKCSHLDNNLVTVKKNIYDENRDCIDDSTPNCIASRIQETVNNECQNYYCKFYYVKRLLK